MDRPSMRISGPTIDSGDPIALAEFYHRLLSWPIVRQEGPRPGNPPADGWAMLRSPDGRAKIEIQSVRVVIDPDDHPFCLFPDDAL